MSGGVGRFLFARARTSAGVGVLRTFGMPFAAISASTGFLYLSLPFLKTKSDLSSFSVFLNTCEALAAVESCTLGVGVAGDA